MHDIGSMMRFAPLVFVAGCMGNAPPDFPHGTGDPPPDGGGDLGPLPESEGRYRGACDGSSGAALDGVHFASFADEDQRARVFARGAVGAPVATIDVAGALGVAANAEADLEEVVRVGDRLYVIGSHGRKKDGTLDRARYRFAAVQIAGTAPDVTFTPVGSYGRLLDDLLVAARWDTPDPGAIAALAAASQLDEEEDEELAPKAAGTNIEGLARAPSAAAPERMVIGLRNPRPGNRALVVTLLNAPDVVGGAPARFGEAVRLDLGGLGIRGMAWSEPLGALLVLAGPHDDAASPFRLYRWAGSADEPAELVRDLDGLPGHPEAIVTYAGTRDVQVLLDGGTATVGGSACEDLDQAQREFRDVIIHLD